ncbi:MAG TPA: 1-phosphofructokinase family hexose kinase [Opitutaceae bacterium]
MAPQFPEVLSVTLNPAIDETAFVDKLTPGTVHRATSFHRQAGGKGINVAAMLADAGHRVAVTGFLGVENPRVFELFFRDRGLQDLFIRLPGATRTGIKLVEAATHQTTDVNLPGLEPSAADLESVGEVLTRHASSDTWVVISGSLPPGVEPGHLRALVGGARGAGARVAVDTSGPALRATVEAGVDFLKPNRAELAELTGRNIDGFADALEAATDLRRQGVAHVVVSLGHEGALFLNAERNLIAGAPSVEVVSTVGAGDALLAGYLSGLLRRQPAEERARTATVFAWCALESLDRALVSEVERAARAARISLQPLPE